MVTGSAAALPELPAGYRGAVFVTPEFPWPTTSGGRARAASIAEALASFGAVTVLAPDNPAGEPAWDSAALRHRARRRSRVQRLRDIAMSVLRRRHVVLERAVAAGLPSALSSVLSGNDSTVVILGRPFWGPFIDVVTMSHRVAIIEADESLERVERSLIASQAPWPARVRAMLEVMPHRHMERTDFPRASEIWVSTVTEMDGMSGWVPSGRLRLIANTVQLPDVGPPVPPPIRAVAFLGYYPHPPNEEAALRLIGTVMPGLRAQGGPSRLVLIGREPTRRMRQAATHDPDVAITGEVSDVRAALREAGVLVMPVQSGGGSRIKALEAVAAGVPVVSTAFGIEGLGLVDGRDALVADSTPELVDAVMRLRDDADLRYALVASAWRHVEAHHSRATLLDSIEEAIARSAKSQDLG